MIGGRGTQVLAEIECLRGATLDSAVVEAVTTLQTARYLHTATLLSSGEVLVAGGNGLSSAELYNPETGTFRRTDSMNISRQQDAAAPLGN